MPDHGIFEKVEIYGAVPGFIIRHTRPGSQIVKSHWHPELEINTAFEGSSRFFINGRVEDVTPQHIVLVNSREVHSSIHRRLCHHRHHAANQLLLLKKPDPQFRYMLFRPHRGG